MSKYQEALIRIRDLTDVQVDVDDLHNFVTGSSFEADIEKLQDLVDKETPMKPKKDTEDNVRWKYYCPGCGQKIDWSKK